MATRLSWREALVYVAGGALLYGVAAGLLVLASLVWEWWKRRG